MSGRARATLSTGVTWPLDRGTVRWDHPTVVLRFQRIGDEVLVLEGSLQPPAVGDSSAALATLPLVARTGDRLSHPIQVPALNRHSSLKSLTRITVHGPGSSRTCWGPSLRALLAAQFRRNLKLPNGTASSSSASISTE